MSRSGVVGIFCDIDDTLTWEGRLVPAAFMALERARAAGLKVIPITGRPAGWVDHFARMWPVDGVVGENGGLWFFHDGHKLHRGFLQDADVRAHNKAELAKLADVILAGVPGTALASDQPYRELDLAIDFCEDVPRLPWSDVDRIVALFQAAGATCKVSSIHVNGWFGTFDKLVGCRHLLHDLGLPVMEHGGEGWIYVGDSANDSPMFHFFDRSVGVANVREFLDKMPHAPEYVTEGNGGHGFAQVIDHLLG